MSSMTHSGNWDTAQIPRLVRDSGGGSYVAPQEKAREAQAVASDVEAFLAAGGMVEVIQPPGSVGEALAADEQRYRRRTSATRDKRLKGGTRQKTQRGRA
ncbi:hypothetical protein [Stenotrophomonas sp. MMGLT7]|uniref:hypothetical protein n=1 Tax=Stenotrophomonas sp. MMGLT7 TaxID=2901227 RepID=UPI001E37CCB8|nr:hypothetical protein [Stenotrophomonas sp. MMGLT7]MCD7096963.1 hypothetical protein [Stenotrophomonas sp. MMGLT7]